jgi:hypothetical protein
MELLLINHLDSLILLVFLIRVCLVGWSNYYNIGTATSDTAGKYSLVWEPPISGEFSIFATFAGSESYGSSFDSTTMFVAELPEPTAAPDPTPAPMTDTYVIGLGVAAIIAIIIMGLLILMKVGKK